MVADDELAWLRRRLLAGADREEVGSAEMEVRSAEMDFDYDRSDVLKCEGFVRARAYWSARGVSLPEWLPWDA